MNKYATPGSEIAQLAIINVSRKRHFVKYCYTAERDNRAL